MRRALAAGSLVVLAAALTACGSTVTATNAGGASSTGDGYGGTQSTATATTGTGVGQPGSASGGAAGSGSATSPAPGQTDLPVDGGTIGTGPSGSVQGSGMGFTPTTVNLGVQYATGGDAAFAAAGFSSVTTGDAKGLVQALINDRNAHGGVLGRKIVPIWHETKVSASNDENTVEQAACSDFNQDHHVFAAITNATDCMVKAKVPSVGTGGMGAITSAFFTTKAPYFYFPTAMNTDSLTPLYIDRLVAKDFLTPKSRIGIFYGNETDPTNAEHTLKAALKARGLNVVSDYAYDETNAGNTVTSISAAVVRFHSARVDRVLSYDANIGIFMINAQQQGYHPLYALTTYMNLASVQESIPPKQQLVGSVGVGWQPANDVDQSRRSALPGDAECEKAMKDSNQTGSGTAGFILRSYCDAFTLLMLGAERGGGFSALQIRAGLTGSGTLFKSALNFSSAYTLGRYDGALGARDVAYIQSCSCFQYTGTTIYSPR